MNVKNQQLLWDLYAGIAMNVKKQTMSIMGFICEYYIFENGLMELIIIK